MHSASSSDLAGKLLIAMPGMGDPRFERSVVYMCAHAPDASMGLIVNKPAPDLTLRDLLDQLSITPSRGSANPPVHFGGPVEGGRGFVLHSADYDGGPGTLDVDDAFAMTATLDVLKDMAEGEGPRAALVALGYAGWGEGQLEGELTKNAWLVADATPEVVFGTPNGLKWAAALRGMGIEPTMLSGAAGRA
ncbi:DUF179 domain-containing protein [Rhodobacteraceae bacterium CCMM004]|nr:DUF179 domain-containing protein [Rhodobacteraceae bacterium CCMM004]